MSTRRDLIEETYGRWAVRIHDDQPIADGKEFAADSRVEVVHDGAVFKEFMYPGYRIWTLLAHWKDGLDPHGVPEVESDGVDDDLTHDEGGRAEARDRAVAVARYAFDRGWAAAEAFHHIEHAIDPNAVRTTTADSGSAPEHNVADMRCAVRSTADEGSFLAWCPICSPEQYARARGLQS